MALGLGSCGGNWSITLGNSAPVVSLSSSSSSVYSDQSFTVTASASDADGDFLSYTWSLDGTTQSASSSVVDCYFLESYSSGSHSISVTVSDGTDSATSTIYVTVYGAGSLRVYNQESSFYLTQLYCTSSYDSGWGTDYISSNVAPGGSYILYNIDPDYYDAKVVDDWGSAYTAYSKYYYAGTPRSWSIYVSSSSFSNKKDLGPVSTFTDGSEITARAGIRSAQDICLPAGQFLKQATGGDLK
jgi:hypothetical protein